MGRLQLEARGEERGRDGMREIRLIASDLGVNLNFPDS
jgi:hypothetical protein